MDFRKFQKAFLKIFLLMLLTSVALVFNQCALEKKIIQGDQTDSSFDDIENQDISLNDSVKEEMSSENSVVLNPLKKNKYYVGLKTGLELHRTYQTLVRMTGMATVDEKYQPFLNSYKTFKFILPTDRDTLSFTTSQAISIIQFASHHCKSWWTSLGVNEQAQLAIRPYTKSYFPNLRTPLYANPNVYFQGSDAFYENPELQNEVVQFLFDTLIDPFIYLTPVDHDDLFRELVNLLNELVEDDMEDGEVDLTTRSLVGAVCTTMLSSPYVILKD